MKNLCDIAVFLLLLTSCGHEGAGQSAKKALSTPLPPPPAQVPPGDEEIQRIILAAKEAGFGECNDVIKIKTVPLKGEFGGDPTYDRIMGNFPGYNPCLIQIILDETPIEDRRSSPARYPFFVGDLAYDLIIDSGKLDYQTCMTDEVRKSYQQIGYFAFHAWLHEEGNRIKLQNCVVKNIRL